MSLSDRLRSFDPHGRVSPAPRFFSELSEPEIGSDMKELLISQADMLLDEPVPILPALSLIHI